MRIAILSAGLCLAASALAPAQTFEVTGAVTVVRKDSSKAPGADHSNVVVWLKPTAPQAPAVKTNSAAPPRLEIRQTHKRFEPHILAVPVGSTVWFPNLDPFFHNVFSLYDGNRFDLGLYEAGVAHNARFDRPGICFIFCNIHPEMSAVVVVVDGPYGVSNREGRVTIPNVAPGQYLVHTWHERTRASAASALPITVAAGSLVLPPLTVLDSGETPLPHKNKYGLDYPTPPSGVIYK